MSADDVFKDLSGPLRSLVADIYARGYKEGAAAMRASIIKAADLPLNEPAPVNSHASPFGAELSEALASRMRILTPAIRERSDRSRAPHGAVSTAVELVLRETPGLSMREIVQRVIELDDRISPSSVGTELRRYDTDRYHQDGSGGWFLGGTPLEEKEEPGDEPDSSLSSSNERG